MRVMYVAPRYHTNQIPVVKGWLEHGDQVMFCAQYVGTPEDYSLLKPTVAGYSRIFELLMKIYCGLFCRYEKTGTREFAFRVKAGFPPFGMADRLIKSFAPDLVILRERCVYNVPFYRSCKRRGIFCILYNQSPLWDAPERDRGALRGLFLKLLPRLRMTPVFGREGEGRVIQPHSFYVPFVMEPHFSPEQKPHFTDGEIHLLCVGRYEERKNLIMLLDALQDLIPVYRLRLTIVGELTDEGQKEYYARLRAAVDEKRLSGRVSLLSNYTMEQMYEEYKKADLFILPSTRERASVSQLEAMSCSLPVICSDTNGSACYVEDRVNGRLFRDNDMEDLKRKTEELISDRERLMEMGRESFRFVLQKYQFENYREKLTGLMESS